MAERWGGETIVQGLGVAGQVHPAGGFDGRCGLVQHERVRQFMQVRFGDGFVDKSMTRLEPCIGQ